MADVLLTPLLQVCFDKLADPVLNSFKMLFNLEKDMDRLRKTLSMIQLVLEDAEKQQVRDGLVKLWLERLKEVAYDADDLLDEFISANLQNRRGWIPYEVMALKYKNFSKLKHIQNKFDMIMEDKSKFQFREVMPSKVVDTRKRKQTGSFTVESKVYGRTEDIENMIDLLFQTTPVNISIIPIVGIGGLGKTTLARLAYNDRRVSNHFQVKMWACVTDEFDVVRVIKSMIESGTKSKCQVLEMDALQSQLWDLLNGKRYLLGLDDVWTEDQDEWEELHCLLRGGAVGSKVIVTTRSKKVAAVMGTNATYDLQVLSEEDCWGLFKQRAFGPGEEERYSNLLKIGKEILKKCGGLPLAAKTVGSLMRFKREEREWLFVQESELWNVCEGENGILPALRLSYNHLPAPLRLCFAYCSVFPKNYVVKKETLIRLWIAQDFIRLSGRNERTEVVGDVHRGMTKTLEDVGNEYFNILQGMSFFQDPVESVDGGIIECKMHDCIHDLATSVAGSEFKVIEGGHVTGTVVKVRHSSIVCDFKVSEIPEDLYEATKLRTLLVLSPRSDFSAIPPKIFSKLIYLQVLHLSGCGIESVPSSISNLLCLRYLDLSYTFIETLPEDLMRLQNLQSLNLLDCYNLKALPIYTSMMERLRHLNIKGCESLACMPAKVGLLKDLQTLPIFIVGEEKGKRITELGRLNLQGELQIKCLENVRGAWEASKADLKGKRHIDVLGLSWGGYDVNRKIMKENRVESLLFRMMNKQQAPSVEAMSKTVSHIRSRHNVEELVDCLEPNNNLKTLLINGYEGSRFPSWMMDIQFPYLREVQLVDCNKCKQLPKFGQLPSLEILYMQGISSVKHIYSEFYGSTSDRNGSFPSLKELTLEDFPNLEEWLSMVFPQVVKLTIRKCPKLMDIPLFPCLQHLEIQRCSVMILGQPLFLPELRTLVIDVVPELPSLPDGLFSCSFKLTSLTISSCPDLCSLTSELGNLVRLKALTIRWCEQLSSLPRELRRLVSLESLEISDCHSVVSLPEEGMEGLISLRRLSIENCNSLISLPLGSQSLASLENLTIMYCPKLTSLPEDLQNLKSLRSISILNCPELALLPRGLQHVRTLQNLELRNCPGLTALPEWIDNLISLRSLAISGCCNLTSFPEGLQRLNALQHLSVQECPDLERRCEKDRGEDWQKISHIPHVYIGSHQMPKSDQASSSSS